MLVYREPGPSGLVVNFSPLTFAIVLVSVAISDAPWNFLKVDIASILPPSRYALPLKSAHGS